MRWKLNCACMEIEMIASQLIKYHNQLYCSGVFAMRFGVREGKERKGDKNGIGNGVGDKEREGIGKERNTEEHKGRGMQQTITMTSTLIYPKPPQEVTSKFDLIHHHNIDTPSHTPSKPRLNIHPPPPFINNNAIIRIINISDLLLSNALLILSSN